MGRYASKVVRFIKQPENILVLSIVIAVLLAFCVVVPIRSLNPTQRTVDLIRFPGDVFFNLMKMCILPVVICSIVTGVTSMDIKTSRKLGIVCLVYYLSTTFLASIIGCTIIEIVQPGKYASKLSKKAEAPSSLISPDDSIMDLFRNLFPENIVQATFQQVRTKYRNKTVNADNETVYTTQRYQDNVGGTNFMGIIFFSIFFGFVLMTFEERAKPFIKMINLLNDVSMRMMMYILTLSPVGIFFLIVATLISFQNMESVIRGMGMLMLSTSTGLVLLWIVIYPALYFAFVRKNPYRVIARTSKATFYAFAVTSSSATLPLTLHCCEKKLGVRKAVTRFMLPIGAMVNMDGTSLHEGSAALFIAQLNGIDLGFGEKILVCLMGALSSIACSTTPGAGIVALLMVLTAAGLPTDDISLFFMTDWIMSRVRTATNVLGDSFATTIVEKICEKELKDFDGKVSVIQENDKYVEDDDQKENIRLSEDV